MGDRKPLLALAALVWIFSAAPLAADEWPSGATLEETSEAASQRTGERRNRLVEKAEVGLANVATGWLELPKSVAQTYNRTNLIFAVTGGVIKGVVHSLGRTGAGLWDFLTAPLPGEPIPNPPHIWDDWRRETRYGPVFAPPGSRRQVVIDFLERPPAR